MVLEEKVEKNNKVFVRFVKRRILKLLIVIYCCCEVGYFDNSN